MKGIFSTASMGAGLLLLSAPLSAATTRTFKFIPEKSQVIWMGKKVTGDHYGTVGVKEGVAIFRDGKLVGGSAEIDMNSISVLDITDKGYNDLLINHLKSDHFFSVKDFPLAKMEIVDCRELARRDSKGINETRYRVEGNLSIKNITRSVVFEVKMNERIANASGGGTVSGSGSLKIDRTAWKIEYLSGKFFSALGDKLIYDDIELEFKFMANE